MEFWHTFTNPNLGVTLQYPDPTPNGQRVEINNLSNEASYRFHFTSEDLEEVYFEVGVYHNLTAREAIRMFLTEVTGRIDGLEVNEVRETTFAGHSALRLSIQWPGMERIVLFVERGATLYRIIRNPKSQTNQVIFDSLQFT